MRESYKGPMPPGLSASFAEAVAASREPVIVKPSLATREARMRDDLGVEARRWLDEIRAAHAECVKARDALMTERRRTKEMLAGFLEKLEQLCDEL